MRLAAIDLGSNSFHAVVAELSGGALTRLWSGKHTLALGALVTTRRTLPEPAIAQAVDRARDLAQAARGFGCRRVALVATSALREASNGAALAQSIERATGYPVRLLSGNEEAALVYRGARSALPGLPARVGVIDLGGGSAEIAVGDGDRMLFTISLPLGFLRLAPHFERRERDGCAQRRLLRNYVAAHTRGVLHELWNLEPGAWLLTGGSARALGKLRPGAGALSGELLEALADELFALSPEELVARGVDPTRAGSFALAVALLAALAGSVGAARVRVSPGGLRDGVLLRELELARPAALAS